MDPDQQSLFSAYESDAPWAPVAPAVNLAELNPAQRKAAECISGPLLVLAGAGSGKTRVLTYRIAHLIGDCGYRPWQILAITFTNKAAAEMRERLGRLVDSTRGMWVCTFHAMCVRMLREDGERLGYGSNFSIYDDDDSRRLVTQIMNDLNLDQKQFPLRAVRAIISNAKNAMQTPEELESNAQGPMPTTVARVWRELDQRLKRANAMDFDDLLLKAYELLHKNPDVLERYQDRFLQISVDEYQDTNKVQYAITNLLAARYRNLMVVGDDDQSIYSWRGADIRNILAFEKDYPDATVVKLEQNYRSTGHILAAANAVVANNRERTEKRLFTDAGDGELVRVFQAADERDEGRWIGAEIEKLHDQGTSYDSMAVFYRTNAQSRILEDMFLRAGVPYKVVGGTRFFDRAEIRDVMAYLKLVVNPADDVSALRVVNTPRRGIGTTSVGKISSYATSHGCSFFEAAQMCVAESGLLTARVRTGLAEFVGVIETGRAITGGLAEVVEAIVQKAGLISALSAEHSIEADGRIENIREFFGVAAEFDETHDNVAETLESLRQLRAAGALEDAETIAAIPAEHAVAVEAEAAGGEITRAADSGVAAEKLPAFMEWLALRTDLDSLAGSTSAVTMMTIHSAKGLEYPVVFVAGMEENIFPHRAREGENGLIEEERRLAYVAITRAERRLYLTYATTRRVFGQTDANPRSRFINEIPEEHLQSIGVGSSGFSGTGWAKRGDRHGTYGSGRGSEVYGGNVFGSRTRSTGGSGRAGSAYGSSGFGTSGFGASARGESARKPGIQHDAAKADEVLVVGDHVSHKTFGPGVVKSVSGDVIEVHFTRTGKTKRLMKGFAPIVKVEG